MCNPTHWTQLGIKILVICKVVSKYVMMKFSTYKSSAGRNDSGQAAAIPSSDLRCTVCDNQCLVWDLTREGLLLWEKIASPLPHVGQLLTCQVWLNRCVLIVLQSAGFISVNFQTWSLDVKNMAQSQFEWTQWKAAKKNLYASASSRGMAPNEQLGTRRSLCALSCHQIEQTQQQEMTTRDLHLVGKSRPM